MSTDQRFRILLIDNDPVITKHLTIYLEKEYQVITTSQRGAALSKEAEHLAQTHWPHVVIIDMRLEEDDNPNDSSGLKLAKKLQPNTKCILNSAYLTVSLTQELRDYPNIMWSEKGQKTPDIGEQIVYALGVLASAAADTLTLPMHWNEKEILGGFIGEQAAASAPDGVLEALLLKALEPQHPVGLKWLAPPSDTHAGAVILRLESQDPTYTLSLVRLGKIDALTETYRVYQEELKGDLQISPSLSIQKPPVQFWQLGALIYQAPTLPERSWSSYYQDSPLPQAPFQLLARFFEHTWLPFFQKRHLTDKSILAGYLSLYGLQLPGDLNVEKPDMAEFSEYWRNPWEVWDTLTAPNQAAGTSWICKTLGGVKSDGLWLDQREDVWPLGYEMVAAGPLLTDFTALEVDIVSRLACIMPGESALFANLAALLLSQTSPNRFLSKSAKQAFPVSVYENPRAMKALGVVVGVRNLARRLTGFSRMEDVYTGLLCASLAAYRRPRDSAQRNTAAILAGLSAARLADMDAEWKPSQTMMLPDEIDLSILAERSREKLRFTQPLSSKNKLQLEDSLACAEMAEAFWKVDASSADNDVASPSLGRG